MINNNKQAKYYSILLNFTRYSRQFQQIFTILRCFNTSSGAIEENIIRVLASTEYLTNAIMAELEKYNLDIQTCIIS